MIEPDFAPDAVCATMIEDDLNRQGWALLPAILSRDACTELAKLYDDSNRFRSKVVMARYGFGRGEYQYLAYPLPDIVQSLRTKLYDALYPIANQWNAAMGIDVSFPADHATFLERCHSAGQTRPTPLLLRYGPGDYNCLHQDIYGEHVFPLQVAILLSDPVVDFSGGEFVLTEQRPRMQSRAIVAPLQRGDAIVFPVRHRPVTGSRGTYRVNLRHGVSEVHSGARHTLGIIFHDAG
jgi:uncharacterized protein